MPVYFHDVIKSMKIMLIKFEILFSSEWIVSGGKDAKGKFGIINFNLGSLIEGNNVATFMVNNTPRLKVLGLLNLHVFFFS